MQYLLDPWDTHGLLGSEQLEDLLCGEFGVTRPDVTDANAGDSKAIGRPPGEGSCCSFSSWAAALKELGIPNLPG